MYVLYSIQSLCFHLRVFKTQSVKALFFPNSYVRKLKSPFLYLFSSLNGKFKDVIIKKTFSPAAWVSCATIQYVLFTVLLFSKPLTKISIQQLNTEYIKLNVRWSSLKNLCYCDACKTILKALIQQPKCWNNFTTCLLMLSHDLLICTCLSQTGYILFLLPTQCLSVLLCTFQNWLCSMTLYTGGTALKETANIGSIINSVINSPSQFYSMKETLPNDTCPKNSFLI